MLWEILRAGTSTGGALSGHPSLPKELPETSYSAPLCPVWSIAMFAFLRRSLARNSHLSTTNCMHDDRSFSNRAFSWPASSSVTSSEEGSTASMPAKSWHTWVAELTMESHCLNVTACLPIHPHETNTGSRERPYPFLIIFVAASGLCYGVYRPLLAHRQDPLHNHLDGVCPGAIHASKLSRDIFTCFVWMENN